MTATYWSSPIRREERRVTEDIIVVTRVRSEQNKGSTRNAGAVWSRRLRGVKRNKETRLEMERLRINLELK